MSPPHTLVYVAPFGLEQKTTVWARTLPLAQALAGRGHRPTILVPPWDSPAAAGQCFDQGGVRVEQVRLAGGPPAVLARLLRRIHELAPDIVHVVKPRAYAGLVQWRLWQSSPMRRPRLLLDVDDWEQAWAPINGYRWPLARFLAWQEEWGIRHADGLTAASQWLVERTAAAAPAMPRLYLPNGITPPTDEPPPAPEDGPPQVLYLGRFVEVPPEWLARFAAALHRSRPDAELVIAGQALHPHLERDLRRALASAQGVHWRGYVPPDELPALYARATCAIFPALPTPLHLAKCSVRLATTLLQGVPVVASAVGEQTAYGATGAAHLVPAAATPEQFATAVVQVLAEPAARAALRQNARAHLLERYDWTRLAAELEEFYDQIIAHPA